MSIWELTATGSTVAPDLIEVRRALAVLVDPSAAVQVQAAPAWKFYTCRGDDLDTGVAWVAGLDGPKGVYYTLNPVPPGLDKHANGSHVLNRRWFLVDVDRAKAEGNADLSATDAEHEDARALANDVFAHLDEQGWPAPVIVDSGNGFHLLYRIDLPNDKLASAILKRCLAALAEKFDGPRGAIGVECHDARRVAKLPGTWARRGPASENRPHRLCRLVSLPDTPAVVSVELLQKVGGAERSKAAAPPPEQEASPASPFVLQATADREAAYGKSALERECAKVALARPGGRNQQLNDSAFALGQLVAGQVLTRQQVEVELRMAAYRCKLDEDPGCGPRGIEGTIRSGVVAGLAHPRTVPEFVPPAELNGKAPKRDLGPKVKPGQTVIIRASEIVPRKVEWLWPGRIPLGKLTTFAGVGGLGKTFVLCDITARVTRGQPWPDAGGECAEAGSVLFVSGEDDPDDTLVPRLIELGADLDRVVFLTTDIQDRFTLADLGTLDLAVDQAGGNVRFVAIDPPTAYLGGVDDHKNAELRSLLSPLKNWAARRRVALVFNTHVNKGGAGKIDAMQRVLGSVAWVNAVRAAHMFTKDPDDPSRRLFIGMKMNIGRERKGLCYRIVETHDDMAKVEWLGEVDLTADEAVSFTSKPRGVVASEWLIDRFRERLEWPSDELFRTAHQQGVSRSAIFEAKQKLGLPKARRDTAEDGGHLFVWWVPADWPPLKKAPDLIAL